MPFYPVSSRAAGHGVRCTLLALRLSARTSPPPEAISHRTSRFIEHSTACIAVRWLDTHCHLNAIAHVWSRRHVHA